MFANFGELGADASAPMCVKARVGGGAAIAYPPFSLSGRFGHNAYPGGGLIRRLGTPRRFRAMPIDFTGAARRPEPWYNPELTAGCFARKGWGSE